MSESAGRPEGGIAALIIDLKCAGQHSTQEWLLQLCDHAADVLERIPAPSPAGPDALAKLIEKLEAWARSLEAEAVVEEYQPRREIFERRRDALRQACAALRSRPAQSRDAESLVAVSMGE